MYDENGKVRIGRNKEPLKRKDPDKVDCVTGSCPKGHYKNPVKATLRIRKIIALYEQSKASNGGVLSESQRSDKLIAHIFAQLDTLYRQAEQLEIVNSLASVLLLRMK